MPWTETTRCQYERNNERYSSDVTDAEWAVIFPFGSVYELYAWTCDGGCEASPG